MRVLGSLLYVFQNKFRRQLLMLKRRFPNQALALKKLVDENHRWKVLLRGL